MDEDPILEVLSFSLANTSTSAEQSQGPVARIPMCVALGTVHCPPCFSPKCNYICPSPLNDDTSVELFLTHLIEDHRIVVPKIKEIANLYQYSVCWKQQLVKNLNRDEPEEFKKLGDPSVILENSFYSKYLKDRHGLQAGDLVCIPRNDATDQEIRERLWTERLEMALETNRFEREQTDFSRTCLFCKETLKGNRKDLFNHMMNDHNFYIGHADNVVFVDELCSLIESKLSRLICIYCEKTFRDRTVLREHMRKKQHKQLNSENSEYDKFYLMNYLEPGKTWKTWQQSDDVNDDREEEWTETTAERSNIFCLLCSACFSSMDATLEHMKTRHCFDFKDASERLDFYEKVKLVNFFRRKLYQNICVACGERFLERAFLYDHYSQCKLPLYKVIESNNWKHAEYFFPTYENDEFLIHLEGDDEIVPAELQSNNFMVIPEDV